MMLKPWMVIAGVTFAIALFSNILRPRDIRWFIHLERPNWLFFEKLIPVIWCLIFVAGAVSAHQVWQQEPGTSPTWIKMAGYVVLEILVVAYAPVMLWSRSLDVGTTIGVLGLLWGLFLTVWVAQTSATAALLLLPYLLWAPIGSYTTWAMKQLNPESA